MGQYFHNIDYYPDFIAVVSFWMGNVGLLSILVTLLGIWDQRRDSKNKEKERHIQSCKSMLEELKDHEITFDDKEYHERFPIGDKTIVISDTILSTDVYESIIHSGFFTYLEIETQNELSGLYNIIKNRNDLLIYLNRYDYTLPAINEEYLEARWSILADRYITLSNWEDEIKELIKTVRILLEDEIRIFKS
jgi:hypothetical protein